MLENIAWAAVAVALPALLRFVVDQGQSGLPYLTFFPAMLLVAIFLGWRYGALIALLNAVVANRLFTPEPVEFFVNIEGVALLVFYIVTCAIVIGAGWMLRVTVRDQDAAARREDAAEREQLRRNRNLLSMVQSLVQLTARHDSAGTFPDVLDKRIWALGKGSEFQRLGGPDHCKIADLVAAVIAPLREDGNFSIAGQDCRISADACIPLALALHELGSNAARHGALSVSEGRVNVSWTCEDEPDAVVLRWHEQGGPPVAAKPKNGTGSALLRPQGGLRDVRVRFEPGGVECELVVEGAPAS